MATESKKISDFDTVTSVQGEDVLPIVRKSGANSTNYKIKVKDLLAGVSSNTVIEQNLTVEGTTTLSGNTLVVTSANTSFLTITTEALTVSANGFVVSEKYTPPSSSLVEAVSGVKVSFDDNYMYVRVANNVVKRVALETF